MGRLSRFPDHILFWGHFRKISWFIAPEVVPWLSKKCEDEPRGPRTNLDVFGDEVSFQYFQKHEHRLPPCHVRPNSAKVRGNRIVWSMPCPRTPPDLTNTILNFQKIVFVKKMFSQFLLSRLSLSTH